MLIKLDTNGATRPECSFAVPRSTRSCL